MVVKLPVGIGGIRCRPARSVVAAGVYPQYELTGDRHAPAGCGGGKLHDHSVVVLRQQRHRVFYLIGKRNCTTAAAGTAAGVVVPGVSSDHTSSNRSPRQTVPHPESR